MVWGRDGDEVERLFFEQFANVLKVGWLREFLAQFGAATVADLGVDIANVGDLDVLASLELADVIAATAVDADDRATKPFVGAGARATIFGEESRRARHRGCRCRSGQHRLFQKMPAI